MLKKGIKSIAYILTALSVVIFTFVFYYDLNYPDRIYTSSYQGVGIGRCTVSVDNRLKTVSTDSARTQRSVMKLFGVIPVKDVNVSIAPERWVVVSGEPFGVMLYSDGVMVVGSNCFDSQKGNINPAERSGILIGDIILKINGNSITSIEDVTAEVSASNGKPLTVEYKRSNEKLTTEVTPVKGIDDGKYHIGLWVRDSSAGIGTMTFYNPENGVSVGFGHPICDVDTGNIIEISNGTAVDASLYSVRKGSPGNPGELLGTLKIRNVLGDVIKNTSNGVYFNCIKQSQGQLMPIAYACEVKNGAAQIYTTVDGEGTQYYDVQIERIDPSKTTKNMVVKITDPRLIEKTGGIVQGMSGSPIVQDGKLIGAVTHVLVDDPTKGYGIFAENMLETAQSVAEQHLKEAS